MKRPLIDGKPIITHYELVEGQRFVYSDEFGRCTLLQAVPAVEHAVCSPCFFSTDNACEHAVCSRIICRDLRAVEVK